ncbi:hypothetical protein OUZ56_030847 [Daphnia magna]|uniref:Uncharacterized protein n=1 Tax=Daphnia magna TaxID=35525 RepID=A0ABQ9ZTD2_9CRUS|nr:hypothetical protein OUZ56_030847 [Daphnia magna]
MIHLFPVTSFVKTNGRHPSTKPWVINDLHSGHDCVVNWYHFYKAKPNYVASLLHWTADLDHVSTVKEIMCLNENGSCSNLRDYNSSSSIED